MLSGILNLIILNNNNSKGRNLNDKLDNSYDKLNVKVRVHLPPLILKIIKIVYYQNSTNWPFPLINRNTHLF